jgi:hypothetical protein
MAGANSSPIVRVALFDEIQYPVGMASINAEDRSMMLLDK